MTNKNWSTAYCDLNYASTERLLKNLIYSVSKVNTNSTFTVCTVLQSTNRLIAAFIVIIVFISKSFYLVITHLIVILNRIIEEMVTINTYGI